MPPLLPRLPPDGGAAALRSALSRNGVLLEVLDRAAGLDLPGWYLTGGCVVQTVWNAVTGRPPAHGIKDYDLFFFDDRDLSWEAEDAVVRAAGDAFGGLTAEVEVRNEARVHLWYEERFGVPCAPHGSTEAAIDSFAATTCCVGVRLETGGRWRVYAPHGLSDVFGLVVRPNPVLAPREVYEAKTERWRRQWPELTVLDWPSDPGGRQPPRGGPRRGGGPERAGRPAR
ncbi:nucleotidyltransferase family protein [Streptacidiphilus sp. ASG 303]|uniref:nucleotidyltransferase family protein n=1 Tax=Streptacidiphilus sp. ASG 303 TaxID=2896847 RepID=UPI001E423928|nr:nucleotidyltransferase family protein [Streptacidiphilus sp. ASG 303]MCD0481061.1 nucleotidyltransferase family protein [Streptacidiphilus sp. ASG 303]